MSDGIKPEVFPQERIVFFSDAVFAIAMTLLVIEIKVPSAEKVQALGLSGALYQLTPLFIGYVVSFLVIGLFWVSHLRTWKYVKDATPALVWLNIFELLFVALMPFTTGLYTEYVGGNRAFSLYCLNLALIAVFSYWSRAVVIRRENLVEKIGAHEVAWLRGQTLIALTVFLLCIPLAYVAPLFARYSFVLIFVFMALFKRYLNLRERKRSEAVAGG